MAIDPVRLVQQQHAVGRSETKCSICGGRTREAAGSHLRCRTAVAGIRWEKLTTQQLAGVMEQARAELARRRDAILSALGES